MKDRKEKKRKEKEAKRNLKKDSEEGQILQKKEKETDQEEKEDLDEIESALANSLDAISERIEGLAKRMVQDTITFFWDDTQEEEVVDFTKIWREFSLGIWGRSVDTISSHVSTIMLHAPKGTFIPRHHHPQNQVIFVSEGRLRVYVDGQSENPIVLEENGVASILAEQKHSMLFLEQTIMFCKFEPREYTIEEREEKEAKKRLTETQTEG